MKLHPPQQDTEEDFPSTPLDSVLMDTFEIKAEPRLTCISAWVQGERKVSKGKKGECMCEVSLFKGSECVYTLNIFGLNIVVM